jgi:hypothetical protein
MRFFSIIVMTTDVFLFQERIRIDCSPTMMGGRRVLLVSSYY